MSQCVTLKGSRETLFLNSLYLQVLSDALCDFEGDFFAERLQILHTFLCTTERTSTSLVAELLFPPDESENNPAFSNTEIANSVFMPCSTLRTIKSSLTTNPLPTSYSTKIEQRNFGVIKRNTIGSLLSPVSVSWTG